MANPGSVVVKDGGGWGVLASGAVAVRNQAGECPGCCGGGQPGDCYIFNQGQCSAQNTPPLTQLQDLSMLSSGYYHWRNGPQFSYDYSNLLTAASNVPNALSCYNQNAQNVVSTVIPPVGNNAQMQAFFGMGVFHNAGQLSQSGWVPYAHLNGVENVEPVYLLRIRRTNDFNFYALFNLNTNAVQISADLLGRTTLNGLRATIQGEFGGYTNISGSASVAASIAWQGCVPTLTMNVSGDIAYDYPPNNNDQFRHSVTAALSLTIRGLIA